MKILFPLKLSLTPLLLRQWVSSLYLLVSLRFYPNRLLIHLLHLHLSCHSKLHLRRTLPFLLLHPILTAHPAIDLFVFLPIPPPPPKPISRRQRRSKDPSHTMVTRLKDGFSLRKAQKALLASKHSIPCLDIEIPATPNKALKDPHWRAAMVEEMNFHQNRYLGLPRKKKI